MLTEQPLKTNTTQEAARMARTSRRTQPDPEVLLRAERRSFTTAYKLKVIRDVEHMTSTERGAYLRREGLYDTHLSKWRQAYREGRLNEASPTKRGPKQKPVDPTKNELKRTQRELAKALEELRKARLIIDVQKKLAQMLGVEVPTQEPDSESV